jgi:hypothetical protein
MTQRAYIDQILEPIIKPWLIDPTQESFILEEDGDSSHGPGASNIVRTWKEKNGLQSYFNCHLSPDFSPIENCWQPSKQHVRKYPHQTEDDTKQLAEEGWASIKQSFINMKVDSMPQRLRDCIESDGQMTGH